MVNIKSSGYIAITSVLIISAIALSIVTSTALSSISTLQTSFTSKQEDQGLNLLEGCAEDVLLYLNNNNLLPSSIILPEGTCTVSLNSQINQDWDFNLLGNFNNQSQGLHINATRSYRVTINLWQQVTP